jgi:hypothetical protein
MMETRKETKEEIRKEAAMKTKYTPLGSAAYELEATLRFLANTEAPTPPPETTRVVSFFGVALKEPTPEKIGPPKVVAFFGRN